MEATYYVPKYLRVMYKVTPTDILCSYPVPLSLILEDRGMAFFPWAALLPATSSGFVDLLG